MQSDESHLQCVLASSLSELLSFNRGRGRERQDDDYGFYVFLSFSMF